ncbi:MAG: hypothetical protein EAZ57_05380 [Cytophagales bacterium]|nr:MAG: hypothetical protein EAZ67_06200 [Cytophagales bacterium]TAF60979.1 MAG: hypothetical protein EAZ57_05380 [Cytophagales bacterium]
MNYYLIFKISFFSLFSLFFASCNNESVPKNTIPNKDSLQKETFRKKIDLFFKDKAFQTTAYKFPLLRLPLNETDLASSFDTEAPNLPVLETEDTKWLLGCKKATSSASETSLEDQPSVFAVGRLHTKNWLALIYRQNSTDSEFFRLATFDSSGTCLSDITLLTHQIEAAFSETNQEIDVDTSFKMTLYTETNTYNPENQNTKKTTVTENYYIDEQGFVHSYGNK